jgi:hypothetical protein
MYVLGWLITLLSMCMCRVVCVEVHTSLGLHTSLQYMHDSHTNCSTVLAQNQIWHISSIMDTQKVRNSCHKRTCNFTLKTIDEANTRSYFSSVKSFLLLYAHSNQPTHWICMSYWQIQMCEIHKLYVCYSRASIFYQIVISI